MATSARDTGRTESGLRVVDLASYADVAAVWTESNSDSYEFKHLKGNYNDHITGNANEREQATSPIPYGSRPA